MITLSILIPTFNRANKLLRLLKSLESEVSHLGVKTQIQVLVSDNASTDATPKILSEFSTVYFKFGYFCQTKNIGFDCNLRFLYHKAETDYVWYIADDDTPLPGAIETIFITLQDKNPDALLFSFIQPLGSTFRQFDFPEPIRLVKDPSLAIEYILTYTKLSIFVMRKINFDNAKWEILDKSLGGGWYYISLAFSVMENSENMLLAIITEPLASCDEDYAAITYTPYPFLHMGEMVEHPFVLKYKPNLPEYYAIEGYCQAIIFAFSAKVGSLAPINILEYDKFIGDLEFKFLLLIRRPKVLFQLLSLKLRVAVIWKLKNKVCSLLGLESKCFPSVCGKSPTDGKL